MITEAIVLAGGLGTRLKTVVSDLPKSLAPVAGKPFLSHLLQFAKKEGIQKFIFALGYKSEQIVSFAEENLPFGTYSFSIEAQPLGTGGAIYKAAEHVTGDLAIVLNADTFFGVDFTDLAILHEELQAECTLALKPMQDFDRYGVVEIDANKMVTGFSEKKHRERGLINGGVYALRVESFLKKKFPNLFSFEKDYLEKEYQQKKIYGMRSDAYFIDIGMPADYQRAQKELIQHIH